ncbi:hypothetical protein [Urechidicola croceus]|uniref:Uncharacterized protein n=1 Tax=Urechidicola croceus TaxID=1850246 RepID=A0A1D8P3W5_9FLAO|nr:hypothetical protein [Urechidicola croceus]AOW19216.1 hypothetical protein LPB138_00285 [Urechidicola croceus]
MKVIKNFSDLAIYINKKIIFKELINEKSNLYVLKLVKFLTENKSITIDVLNSTIIPFEKSLNAQNKTISKLKNEIFILIRNEVNFVDIDRVKVFITKEDENIFVKSLISNIYGDDIEEVSSFMMNEIYVVDRKGNVGFDRFCLA